MADLVIRPVHAADVETQRRVQTDLTLGGECEEVAARMKAPPFLEVRVRRPVLMIVELDRHGCVFPLLSGLALRNR